MRSRLNSDDMAGIRRQHADAKKRAALAEGTRHLLRRAQELGEKLAELQQWVEAYDGPYSWRQEALELVASCQCDRIASQSELSLAWNLLQPPLDIFGLTEYERRYRRLERVLNALERSVNGIEERFRGGEQWVACKRIQDWLRRNLTRRGFYTKRLHIHRHHRGLIPGIFDSIPAKSKLTVHRKTGATTLEYPTSEIERGFMA